MVPPIRPAPSRAARSKTDPVFYPKILSTLKSYSFAQFGKDLSAGAIVGIVALPLAVAFAIASGVTPDRGLVTAIVAGFLISALGGSKVQIGGPTGAFVVIIYGIVQKYGVNGLILCTLMAGIILIGMGLLRLGAIIKFIPYPLTVGFTAGIAVVIFTSQIGDFLGLKTGPLPADFIDKWRAYFHGLPTLHAPTAALSALSLLVLIVWPRLPWRFARKIPGSIVAILLITPVVHLFQIPVETIGGRFGAIPSGLPEPVWPRFTFLEIKGLIGPAFTVALLGAIESLLSATVSDGMIESRHRSNTELIAQGAANLASPLFGGIPATGAIARTVTNVKNGGRTPVAGMVHALVLLAVVLLFGRWAALIPFCVLSAILLMVAYHMSEWRSFQALLRSPKMDISVLLTTFLLTVFIDLTVAVEVGMLLSVILFIKRMTDVTTVREVTQEMQRESEGADEEEPHPVPQDVAIYEMEGAFFFGVAETLRDNLDLGDKPPRVMILRMRHVLALDATCIRALNDLRKGCAKSGTQLILEGLHAQPLFALDRAEILDEFGEDNVVENLNEALGRAEDLLKPPPSPTLREGGDATGSIKRV